MERQCVFCRKKATTKEHALPGWVANRFDLRGTFLTTYAEGGNVTKRRQPISAKSMRRKMFCGECQEHFKHLEDRVIPILEPMGKGSAVVLDREQQDVLAAWGAKTACAFFGFIDREYLVPEDQRFKIRDTGSPPRSMFVGFGAYSGPPDVFVSFLPIASKDLPTQRMAYNAVAAFGQVVLKVFGVTEPTPHDTFRIPKDRVVQVWPPWRDPLNWPPPITLQSGDMDDFIGWLAIAPAPEAPTTVIAYPHLDAPQ